MNTKPTAADVVTYIEERAKESEEQSTGPYGVAFAHRAIALQMIVAEIRAKFGPVL